MILASTSFCALSLRAWTASSVQALARNDVRPPMLALHLQQIKRVIYALPPAHSRILVFRWGLGEPLASSSATTVFSLSSASDGTRLLSHLLQRVSACNPKHASVVCCL